MSANQHRAPARGASTSPVPSRSARTGLLLVAACAVGFMSAPAQSAPAAPPVAPVRPVVDTLYGVPVSDPYRYMEDLKDTAVQRWFRDENDYTRAVLGRIPGRAALLRDIEKYDTSRAATVSSAMRLPGGRYFYEKTLAHQQVARLYLRVGLHGAERVVFDPTTLESKGGPQWAISYYTPSPHGRYVAVGASPGGSERAVLHVVDTRTGRATGDVISRAWFGAVFWRSDGRSFFYNRVQDLPPGAPPSKTEEDSRVYLHVLGTNPDRDRLVFGTGASPAGAVLPTDLPAVMTIPGARYDIGLLQHGAANDVTLYAAARNLVRGAHTPWRKLVGVDDQIAGFVDSDEAPTGFAVHGDALYLVSRKDAPRSRVLRISLRHPDLAHAAVVVPQSEAVIKQVVAARDALYVKELDGVVGRLLRVPYTGGAPEAITLPFAGTVTLEAVNPDVDGVLFTLASWTRAPRIYAYDPHAHTVLDTHLQPAGPYDAARDLVSREVQVRSYDGTMVPLSISYRRGTRLNGSNPVVLEAYGAYGITIYPTYSPVEQAWYARGGVFAVAHVRGGGAHGEVWHEAGKKLTKPNTWRDLIACAEYLIAHRYTSSSHLAIAGGSAGGITVGRAMTERPDLFGVVIDAVGLSNPLRFEFSPNGPPNIPEFGSIKTEAGFEDLYAMDSYEHVRDGVRYPAVLLTTGWNDPRVVSWEPGKMAARLQRATASGKPVLLRVDYSGGHGFGSTRSQNEQQVADEMSFMLWQFGVPGFQPVAETP